jgi:Ni/Fe-hydrogenase subunit HybB-like protein
MMKVAFKTLVILASFVVAVGVDYAFQIEPAPAVIEVLAHFFTWGLFIALFVYFVFGVGRRD